MLRILRTLMVLGVLGALLAPVTLGAQDMVITTASSTPGATWTAAVSTSTRTVQTTPGALITEGAATATIGLSAWNKVGHPVALATPSFSLSPALKVELDAYLPNGVLGFAIRAEGASVRFDHTSTVLATRGFSIATGEEFLWDLTK